MQAIIAGAIFASGLVLAMTAAPAAPPAAGQTDKAPTAIDGAYAIVSGQRDGKAIPEAEIKGAVVNITQGKIVSTDKNAKQFFAATYTLDAKKKPMVIHMTTDPADSSAGAEPKKPMTADGLVKKDGDTLTIIYALPGGQAPTDFKTGEKQQMFVMKTLASLPKLPNKFPPANPGKP
jgi:uncharacterized protein (TIGR03067 family)